MILCLAQAHDLVMLFIDYGVLEQNL